jgi:hypothetical protein
MPSYILLLRDDPKQFTSLSPDEMQRVIQKYSQWARSIGATGRAITGEKLRDESGRVLRREGSTLRVLDGPFVETKEVVGGFFRIDAADYEEAVRLSRECPQLEYGSVEVREIETM